MRRGTGAVQRNGTGRYTVPQAARLLGISERGVRQRISRGTLAAERTGDGWRVPYAAVQDAVPDAAPVPAPGGTAVEPAALADMRAEVAFLRQELQEQRTRHTAEVAAWQERLREAHLLLAQRPALPSGESATPERGAPARPWWARWWPQKGA